MKTTFLILAAVSILLAGGCATTTTEKKDEQVKFSVPPPDAWKAAAEKCVSSLVAADALKSKRGGKAIVAVAPIVNTTWWVVDETLFSHCVRMALIRSQKAISVPFNPLPGQATATVQPDFKLDGTVTMKERKEDGKPIPPVFTVRLKLTDVKTKLIPWEDTVVVGGK